LRIETRNGASGYSSASRGPTLDIGRAPILSAGASTVFRRGAPDASSLPVAARRRSVCADLAHSTMLPPSLAGPPRTVPERYAVYCGMRRDNVRFFSGTLRIIGRPSERKPESTAAARPGIVGAALLILSYGAEEGASYYLLAVNYPRTLRKPATVRGRDRGRGQAPLALSYRHPYGSFCD